QTVHEQRTLQDLGRAIPLRSRRGLDPFATPEWTILVEKLATPRLIADMPETSRVAFVADLRDFLRRYGIRWIVLTPTAALPEAPDPRLVGPPLDASTLAAYRENLRQLGPLGELQVGPETLFEFEATPIASTRAPSVGTRASSVNTWGGF